MHLPKSATRKFTFERLEERIAPGFLFLGSDLQAFASTEDSVAAAVPRNVVVMDRLASIGGLIGSCVPGASVVKNVSSHTHVITLSNRICETGLRTAMPRWAEELLTEIEAKLGHEPVAVAAGTPTAGCSVATGSGQNVESMTRSSAVSPEKAVMPAWAERVLDEIESRFNNTIVSKDSASCHQSNSTKHYSTHVDDSTTVNVTAENECGLLPWAEAFLVEIENRFCDGGSQEQGIDTPDSGKNIDHVVHELLDDNSTATQLNMSVHERGMMPAWADGFLMEIETRFNKAAASSSDQPNVRSLIASIHSRRRAGRSQHMVH